MSLQASEHSMSDEGPFDQVLAEYLQAADAGRAPDQPAFIARYPEFAAELREFFASQERFEDAARPFRFEAVPAGQDSESAGAQASAGLYEGDATVGNHALLAVAASPGARIRYFGEYELLEEIARGGMGVVFKARQVRLNRVVALKMILAGQFASAEDVKRFQVEAENAAQLDHPNIVPIYEVGTHKGQHYFTMKLVEGGSLAANIERFRGKPRESAKLMVAVAGAVHYAHQRGILHRDLKPGNILLGARGQPQMTDFGLARGLDADVGLTLSGEVLGSPRYMAPEQARGEKGLTVAADVYALGAVLYELLTGTPAFHGLTVLEVLRSVREHDPSPPRSLSPSLDRDVETICLKCLEKERSRRYPSAAALAEDLERWLNGEPIHARPVGMSERARKWMRRHPAASAIAGVAMIAVFAVVALAVALPYAWRLKVARRITEESWRSTQEALTREAAARAEADGLLKRSEAYFYAAHISAADREVQGHHNDRAIEILDACRVPMRRWEWFYLNRLCHNEAETFNVDPSGVASISLSPDATKVVAVTGGGCLRLLDLATGKAGPELHLSRGLATCVAWQPAEERWAVGDSEGGISLWDASTTVQNQRVQTHLGRVNCVAFDADGHQIASGGDDARLGLWDMSQTNPPQVLQGHSFSVNCVCFSRDGHWIASGSGRPDLMSYKGEAIIWELPTTPSTRPAIAATASAASKPAAARAALTHWKGTQITSIAFTPDSCSVIAGCADKVIREWDVKNDLSLPDVARHDDRVTALVYDLDTRRLFSAGGPTVQASTGDVWYGHRGEVLSLAYDAGASRLLSGSADGTVKTWLPEAIPVAMRLLAFGGMDQDAEFTPDGRCLVSFKGDSAVFLSVATGHEVKRLEGAYGARMRFDAPGKRLAVSEGLGPALYDVVTGKLLRKFAVARAIDADGRYTVAISRDGKRVAGVRNWYPTRCIFVWDADTGVELAHLPLKTDVWDLEFSPDATAIVAAGGASGYGGPRGMLGGIPGDVTLWEVATGKLIREFNGSRYCNWAGAFSPDGKFIAAGGGYYAQGDVGEFNVWDISTGLEVLNHSHTSCVFRVVFSPDGSRLAVGGGAGKNREVKIWDLATGVEILSLKTFQRVVGLAFSPDDRRFAASTGRGVVLWDGTGSALLSSGAATRPTTKPSIASP